MVDTANIREHMEVVGSCGNLVGRVDSVEGISLKLTRSMPAARGEHRYIPLFWVEYVDEVVRLNKPAPDVEEEWQAHAIKEGE